MKSLISYVNENEDFIDPSFKEKVKYSNDDFEKWQKEIHNDNILGKKIFISPYEDESLMLVYLRKDDSNIISHIATYNKKTEVLYCDDIKIFGNEV